MHLPVAWRASEGRRPLLAMPALLFLLLVLPAVLVSALLVPPSEVPDELAHIARADSLRYGQLVGKRRPDMFGVAYPVEKSGVSANPGLLAAAQSLPLFVRPKTMSRERMQELLSVAWDAAPQWRWASNTAPYMPLLYVPAAIGLGVAQMAGAGPFMAIIAARLCNVIAFAALGVAALLLARHGQGLILSALALPMTVSLAGSCNQDGLLIGAFCLAAALLTAPGRGRLWGAAAILGLMLAVKPLYEPLALLPPLAAYVWRRPAWTILTAAILAAVPAVAWYVYAERHATVPFPLDPYTAGPLWPGGAGQAFTSTDPAAQLKVFLHRPELVLLLPVWTLAHNTFRLTREFVGVLGVLDLILPAWVYALWFAVLSLTLAGALLRGRADSGQTWPLWAGLAGLAAIAASIVAVVDGAYLVWTGVGAGMVEGVQGRYFIPLLPLLALVLPRLTVPFGAGVRAALLAPLGVACLVSLVVTPVLIVGTYYLH